MHCEHARDLLGAYVDGELTHNEQHAVTEHVATCAECRATVEDLQRMSQQLRTTGREAMPAGLALRVRAALAREAAAMEALPAQGVAAMRWRQPAVFKQVAALAAACVVSSLITWSALTWTDATAHVEQDVVSAHIRSLLQDSPIQVASSDSHTVKPWFAGRIDFAPDVRDFAAQGFPLVGGRIDYVGDRRVGAVVYKRNLHLVNVFMWPAAGGAEMGVQRQVTKGYNVLHWNKAGVTYWAVSDLNLEELRQLQGMM